MIVVLLARLVACTASVAQLDLPVILQGLAMHASTQPGTMVCRQAKLAASRRECHELYASVAEAAALPSNTVPWPPIGAHSLGITRELESIAQSGDAVSLSDLDEISEAVKALSGLAGWSAHTAQVAPASFPRLIAQASSADPPARLTACLMGAIERLSDELQLSSDAFPILRKRRAALFRAERQLEHAVEALLSDGSFRMQLADADAQPQRREGRVVVPVAPVNKRAVGQEVSASRSGQTVFVEPHELVEVSAAARSAAAAVSSAERRIMAALAALVLHHAPALCDAIDAAAQLDAVLARACLGAVWDGSLPEVGEEGLICVDKARHPLLALRAANEVDAVGADALSAPTTLSAAASPSISPISLDLPSPHHLR